MDIIELHLLQNVYIRIRYWRNIMLLYEEWQMVWKNKGESSIEAEEKILNKIKILNSILQGWKMGQTYLPTSLQTKWFIEELRS